MSDVKGINVLAICGSLRAASYNRAALRTAIELKPPGMAIETADIWLDPALQRRRARPRLSAAGREVATADQGGRRSALRHAGIQLLDSGSAEERGRLGLASPRSTLCRKAGGDHGSRRRNGRHRTGAIRSAPLLRLSRHAPAQQARSAYRPSLTPSSTPRARSPTRLAAASFATCSSPSNSGPGRSAESDACVTPAKAGVQGSRTAASAPGFPLFAGMTK